MPDAAALIAYAGRAFGTEEEAEGLMSMLAGPMEPRVEAEIVAGVQASVPAGPMNKPEKQPFGLYIGNEAHRAIAEYYRVAHRLEAVRTNHIPIATILKEFARSGIGPATNLALKAEGELALRPDIVNLSTMEIYEIKPFTSQEW